MEPGLQRSLFDSARPSFDASFSGVARVALDPRSWLDIGPGWLRGSDTLFDEVLRSRHWGQRTRYLYDREVLEPRLTAHWSVDSNEPLGLPIVDQMRLALSARYGVLFDSVGFNFYRDGHDSVAWHGDKIRKEIQQPIIALVSLGEPRRFLMRPRGGGHSRAFDLGRGDLFVTGGYAQREWQHCVPKVARAGPRISVAFRYGMTKGIYERRPGRDIGL
jgi:alkylated DNA repair dioxygenase AlkB